MLIAKARRKRGMSEGPQNLKKHWFCTGLLCPLEEPALAVGSSSRAGRRRKHARTFIVLKMAADKSPSGPATPCFGRLPSAAACSGSGIA